MLCTAPQSQKSEAREIGTLPNYKEAILTNFLPGTLSLTKNKSRDQILTTIFMEKVLYTLLEEAVFCASRSTGTRCKSQTMVF